MNLAKVLVLALAVVGLATASSDLAVPLVQTSVVDAAEGTGSPVRGGGTDFDYTIEWAWNTTHGAPVGLTPVQDTLIWVASGGRVSSGDPNYMLIFDIRTGVKLDSFLQEATSAWGYRDMCYAPDSDYVYAGTEGSRLDVINATSHQLVATYTVTGSNVPSVVRGLGFDGDSLYSGNFTSGPIVKFSRTGQNCHNVGGVPRRALYGIAVDTTHGKAYVTTADASPGSHLILEYAFPTWQLLDSTYIDEIGIFGGCEMWGADTFLVVLDQSGDSVFCLRIREALAHDCGVTQIIDPGSMIQPGSITPKIEIKNFGTEAQSDIPCYFEIDSSGTNVYSETETYAGPLAPGATAEVTFADWTAVRGTYDLTAWTDLPGDDNPSNDTMIGRTTVSSSNIVWSRLSLAPDAGRYWSPVTGVCRDTLWFVGGRAAANAGLATITGYDILGGNWFLAPETLQTGRRAGGGGQVGNKLYACGGRSRSSVTLNTVEEFDLDTKTVIYKANMPGAGAWASCGAVAGGKVYIIGDENRTGTTYEYDPVANTWATKASVNPGRGWSAAAGAMGKVYVFGGYSATQLNDVQCYDPVANSWSTKASMPAARNYHSAVTVDDSIIYVCGGATSQTADNLVWRYSVLGDAWSVDSPMLTPSGWHMLNVGVSSAADGQAIYVAYGSDCSTPTYLTKLEHGLLPTTAIYEYVPETKPRALDVTPSVGRGPARVRYSVAKAGRVSLGVYDASGVLVRTLVDETIVVPGLRTAAWDRTDDSGQKVPNGTYFYRLTFDGKTASTKSVVLD